MSDDRPAPLVPVRLPVDGGERTAVHYVPDDHPLAIAQRARAGQTTDADRRIDRKRAIAHTIRAWQASVSPRTPTRDAPRIRYGQPWWEVAYPPYNTPTR